MTKIQCLTASLICVSESNLELEKNFLKKAKCILFSSHKEPCVVSASLGSQPPVRAHKGPLSQTHTQTHTHTLLHVHRHTCVHVLVHVCTEIATVPLPLGACKYK